MCSATRFRISLEARVQIPMVGVHADVILTIVASSLITARYTNLQTIKEILYLRFVM